jgi:hypothetical protein
MPTAVAVQPQAAVDRCPWCGSSISRIKFVEIQTKIAEQERNKLATERARMKQEFQADLQKMEARVREEAGKTLATVVAQRDQAAEKVRQLEAMKQKDLEQQRTALEKDRDLQVLKVQAQHNREREQLQEKINALTRQLQRKTADDLGEGAEIDIYEALRSAFPGDDITRIKRGQPGADIRHQLLHKGTPCGTVLIDSKNRQGWQNGYVTKLREDQVAAKADYAVLATTVFPSGKKELYVDEETRVVVVNRARAVEVVGLLRRFMLSMHVLALTQDARADKREQLYAYITSEDYQRDLVEAGRLTTEMLQLDTDEKREHDKVWEKRGKIATRLRNVVRQIDTEVAAIVEGRRPSTNATER